MVGLRRCVEPWVYYGTAVQAHCSMKMGGFLQQNAPGSAARLRKLSAPLESDGPRGQKEPENFNFCAQTGKYVCPGYV